jgi:hypothetical protein
VSENAKDWIEREAERGAPLACDTNERGVQIAKQMMRMAGRIVLESRGDPIRSIITGGKVIWTGESVSYKTGRIQPWESREVELPAMMEAEVRTDVKWWLAQPFRFECHDGLKTLIYIPDQARRVLDGDTWRTEILEFKRSRDEVDADPDYARKIEIFREVCTRIRWRFRIVDIAGLGTTTYRRNIEMIWRDKCVHIDARDIAIVRELARRDSLSYGDACEALGGFGPGKMKLHKLMIRRVVSIPLDRVVTCNTVVSLVDRSVEPIGGEALFD